MLFMMQLYGRNVDGAGGNACEDDDVADDTTRAQRELQEDIQKATQKTTTFKPCHSVRKKDMKPHRRLKQGSTHDVCRAAAKLCENLQDYGTITLRAQDGSN